MPEGAEGPSNPPTPRVAPCMAVCLTLSQPGDFFLVPRTSEQQQHSHGHPQGIKPDSGWYVVRWQCFSFKTTSLDLTAL